MKNIKNNKGFTLAELLIVIAIIAALVAIMIPTFSGQVEKAREAADIANVRSAYAEVINNALSKTTPTTKDVTLTQTSDNWKTDITGITIGGVPLPSNVKGGGTITVAWDATNEQVTLTASE